MKERKLTIFTPIYNRAYCLNNCYQSMRRQKNKRFVWIIVDDGSTDNLESLVSEWIVEESEFQIEYYRKENGGMYTAYNLAFEHIITDYWMCIDSDDWLADDAVDRIYDAIDYVEKKKLSICGIVGLDALQDGTICGGKLPDVDIVGLLELKLKYHHKGDIKVIYSMADTKHYIPMPEIPGEKDFNPYYMMLKMDINKPLYICNHILCIVNYQQDGMTSRVLQSYEECPVSYAMLREAYLEHQEMLVFGSSMAPFLIHARDMIYFKKPDRELQKGDIVFFRRKSGQFVMHRIWKIRPEGYYIVGDAQTQIEGPVKREQIFALITKVRRKEKWLEPGDFWWEFFEHVWLHMIPLRRGIMWCYAKVIR